MYRRSSDAFWLTSRSSNTSKYTAPQLETYSYTVLTWAWTWLALKCLRFPSDMFSFKQKALSHLCTCFERKQEQVAPVGAALSILQQINHLTSVLNLGTGWVFWRQLSSLNQRGPILQDSGAGVTPSAKAVLTPPPGSLACPRLCLSEPPALSFVSSNNLCVRLGSCQCVCLREEQRLSTASY